MTGNDDTTTMDDVAAVDQPLGPRIRVARENAGLGLEAAARRLGVRSDTFAAWERDEDVPRANRLLMLAGLLNVSLAWLLEGRENEFMETQGQTTPAMLRAQLEAIRVRLSEVVDLVEELERRIPDDADD